MKGNLRPVRYAPLVAAVFFVSACQTAPVSETTVNRVLKAPELPNAPYTKILVVGATARRETDRNIEEGLRQHLSKRGIETYSFVRRSQATRPTEEAVATLVADTGADAVLVVSGRFEGSEVRKHDERVDVDPRVRGGSLFDFFRYDYKEVANPAYQDVTLDVVFVSDLYDVETGRRVYSVESATARGSTGYQIIMDESRAIVRRLAKDGLVP